MITTISKVRKLTETSEYFYINLAGHAAVLRLIKANFTQEIVDCLRHAQKTNSDIEYSFDETMTLLHADLV